MSKHGIVVIDWKEDSPIDKINRVLNILHISSLMDGISIYETNDADFVKEVKTLCEQAEVDRDAAIMAELDYEREQAEAEAMYEAEMQAQAEAEAERDAEMQAEYEGGY